MRQAFALKSAVLALVASAGSAAADPAGFELTTGHLGNDPGGTFISVSVKNNTAATVPEIVVTCTFKDGGQSVGTSSTTIYATVAGTIGSDQVRLIGARSTAADCAVTSPK